MAESDKALHFDFVFKVSFEDAVQFYDATNEQKEWALKRVEKLVVFMSRKRTDANPGAMTFELKTGANPFPTGPFRRLVGSSWKQFIYHLAKDYETKSAKWEIWMSGNAAIYLIKNMFPNIELGEGGDVDGKMIKQLEWESGGYAMDFYSEHFGTIHPWKEPSDKPVPPQPEQEPFLEIKPVGQSWLDRAMYLYRRHHGNICPHPGSCMECGGDCRQPCKCQHKRDCREFHSAMQQHKKDYTEYRMKMEMLLDKWTWFWTIF